MGVPRDPWGPWQPDVERPWDHRRAAHLLRRAGFGGTPRDVLDSARRGLDDTVRWLLDAPEPEAGFAASLRRGAREVAPRDEVEALRGGWVHRMVASPWPLVEKMTLFWHDHFATSLDKVVDARLMADQNDLFRRHALGNFAALVRAVSRDPAMIVWLDGQSNRKEHPNENFARELLELFTLGTGNYGETDVKEAARAFTGWHRKGRAFAFDRTAHDPGEKTILGRTGRWDGDGAIGIALDHPAASRFLAGKLFRWFVHPAPEPDLLEPLAGAIREADGELRPVLDLVLRSNVFHSDWAARSIIKSPADYVVGAVLALEVHYPPLRLAQAMSSMGQNLFYPPNVAGWEGGRSWVGAATLLARSRFAAEIARARGDTPGELFDPARTFPLEAGPEALVDAVLDRLLQGEAPADVRRALVEYAGSGGEEPAAKARGLVRVVLALPEYQVG